MSRTASFTTFGQSVALILSRSSAVIRSAQIVVPLRSFAAVCRSSTVLATAFWSPLKSFVLSVFFVPRLGAARERQADEQSDDGEGAAHGRWSVAVGR